MTQEEKVLITDKNRLIAVGGLLAAAIILFYYFAEVSLLFRSLALLTVFIVAAGVFFTTEKGRYTADFLQKARLELKKMVWPTKTETLQTTLIVLVAVIIVALFLWAIDLFLSWFMGLVIR